MATSIAVLSVSNSAAPSTAGRCADVPAPSDVRRRAQIHQQVVALLPLVKKVALQMRERLPVHVELDDLISTGVLGLMDAVEKFDPTKHVRLEHYAQHRIRGAMLDGLREDDPASRDFRRKNKQAQRVYERLEAKLGRAPTDQEMAEGLGLSLGRWYKTVLQLTSFGVDWLRPMAAVARKDAPVPPEETLPADNNGHQFEACYRREQREIFQRAMDRIPEREREIVELYYHHELTMREIGEQLGIDESRVSQLHATAVGRLRRRIREFLERPVPQASPGFAW
jgi:RNA polymerase sigma factor for flagellar operon FliA